MQQWLIDCISISVVDQSPVNAVNHTYKVSYSRSSERVNPPNRGNMKLGSVARWPCPATSYRATPGNSKNPIRLFLSSTFHHSHHIPSSIQFSQCIDIYAFWSTHLYYRLHPHRRPLITYRQRPRSVRPSPQTGCGVPGIHEHSISCRCASLARPQSEARSWLI